MKKRLQNRTQLYTLRTWALRERGLMRCDWCRNRADWTRTDEASVTDGRTHAEHVGARGVHAQWIRSAVPLSLGRAIKQTSTETVRYRLATQSVASRSVKLRRVASRVQADRNHFLMLTSFKQRKLPRLMKSAAFSLYWTESLMRADFFYKVAVFFLLFITGNILKQETHQEMR